jgi:hypothetical protein
MGEEEFRKQMELLEQMPEAALSLWPVEEEGYRGPCVGDVDIDGAGTTGWTYTLNVYYKSRRSTSIYLASQFGCTGGPISGIRYYVSVVPALAMTNLTIRLRHTAASVYTSPYCFDNDGWQVCYQADTTISTTGWYTFSFATPFDYNGVDNLEVDVSFGQNASYDNSGTIWSFSAGTGIYRTIYAYSDTYTNPQGWTCGTGNPTVYSSASVPRVQFIFPPPSTGACCVNYECVATNTKPECDALGGTWYGGKDCATFYCPPWNDNCQAVTPVTLTPGVPVQFTGTNLGATNQCALFAGGHVWEAITLPADYAFYKVTLDYCGSVNTLDGGGPFGNAWLNWAIGCPCTSNTAAGTYDWTTCPDGNVTIRWASLAAGTYYYPVLLDPPPAPTAAGNYVLNVVCTPGYCESRATSTADETLKQVVFESINNLTTNCDTYDDFTYISTDVIAGQTYPFSIIIGDCEGTSCYSKRLAIFVDWNQDYDFVDAGERVYNSGQLGNTPCPDFPVDGFITVPPTATTGCTRMRVIVVETSSTDPSPCGTYTWGATEDYTVCVLPPPPEGACCFEEVCQAPMTEADCLTAGGVYKGDGSDCDPNPCIGACCFTDGSCQETAGEAECVGLGGIYRGDGTDCDPNPCPQPGDNCANPKVFTLPGDGFPYIDTDTTCGRGADYQDTCLGSYDGGEDIIYELILTEDKCLKIAVDGVLTYVGVAIDSACPPGATCIAYATSSSGDPVIGKVDLTAGVYYIMIDTYPSPTCTGFTMTITECPPPPPNDFCANALPVTEGVPAATGNNCEATDDGAASCQTNSHKDVWYKYLAACPGTVVMDTEGSTQSDTVLSVLDACGGTEIACDDDGGTGLLSRLTFEATVGVEYIVRVASYSTGCGGFNLNITCTAPQGACCLPSGACVAEYEVNCVAAGGTYAGDNTACSGLDCNNNGVDDLCDILSGYSLDCQPNGVPDECDIASGTSQDCQGDGIPDECQLWDKGRDIVLTEGFESGLVPPPGWTAVVNNPYTWVIDSYSPYQGVYNASCFYDPALNQQNEWLLSPPLTLFGEATVSGYTMGSVYWEPNYDLNVWVVIGDVGGGDDILLGNADDVWPANWVWAQFSYTFTAPSGPFRIGFQYWGIDGAQASLDAIVVEGQTGAPTNDCNTNGIPDECDIGEQWGGYCTGPDCSSDWNGDGIPDECQLCGDLNGDGLVNGTDYQMFLAAYGTCVGHPNYNPDADLDGDGCITLVDYRLWRLCYKMANGKDFVVPLKKVTTPAQRPDTRNPAQPGGQVPTGGGTSQPR